MRDFCEQFISLENSIAETVRQAKYQMKIADRTRELFGIDGRDHGYSLEQARQQATIDILGAPPNHKRAS